MDNQELQDELVKQIDLANLWKCRAKAAIELAIYLNSLYLPDSSFMNRAQVRKEIEIQGDRLMKLHKNFNAKVVA